jgi:antitoxin component YwqK of YwqJK toxin-antitoxin module
MDIKYTKINKYIISLKNDEIVDIEDFTTNIHIDKLVNFKVGNKYNVNKMNKFKTKEQAFFYKFLENHEYLFFENGFTGVCKIYDGDVLESECFQINGIKNGIEKIYDKNKKNTIHSEIFYCDDKIINKKKFKNNKLVEFIIYNDRESIIEKYYENGNLNEKYTFNKDKKIDGVYIKYFSDNDKINIKCNYINGDKEGLYIEYYKNGDIKFETNYVKDKMNGFYREYYNDNRIKIITFYKDNLLNGHYEEFYNSGKKYIDCHYINNCLDDTYIKYYENENIHFLCNYKYKESITNIYDKNKHGEFIEYYENGEIFKQGNYVNNKLNGEFIIHEKNSS